MLLRTNLSRQTSQGGRFRLIVVVFIAILAVVGAFGIWKAKYGGKIYTIGVMRYIVQLEKVEQGFYKGMEKLGYKENKNVRYIVTPYGQVSEMEGIAQGLIAQNVDLIVAITSVAAGGAKKATESSGRADIPVVFSHSNRPDAQGHIKSFKSSGNNLTGVAVNFPEVTEKKLEFLKRINPNIKRIGALDLVYTNDAGKSALQELKTKALKFGTEIVLYKVENEVGPKSTAEIYNIANRVKPGDIDAFFYIPLPSDTLENTRLIVGMVNRLKIPAAYNLITQVELGGLFSYAHDLQIMGEQTAVFADKVLKGQRPTDIPVEFPGKNTLIINLLAARDSGISIPNSMLNIADMLIR